MYNYGHEWIGSAVKVEDKGSKDREPCLEMDNYK